MIAESPLLPIIIIIIIRIEFYSIFKKKIDAKCEEEGIFKSLKIFI